MINNDMRAIDFLRTIVDIADTLDNKSGITDPVHDTEALDQNPVWLPPQTQELELAKAALGKKSPVIDKLLAPDNIGEE
jgi:hypothetical protein